MWHCLLFVCIGHPCAHVLGLLCLEFIVHLQMNQVLNRLTLPPLAIFLSGWLMHPSSRWRPPSSQSWATWGERGTNRVLPVCWGQPLVAEATEFIQAAAWDESAGTVWKEVEQLQTSQILPQTCYHCNTHTHTHRNPRRDVDDIVKDLAEAAMSLTRTRWVLAAHQHHSLYAAVQICSAASLMRTGGQGQLHAYRRQPQRRAVKECVQYRGAHVLCSL